MKRKIPPHPERDTPHRISKHLHPNLHFDQPRSITHTHIQIYIHIAVSPSFTSNHPKNSVALCSRTRCVQRIKQSINCQPLLLQSVIQWWIVTQRGTMPMWIATTHHKTHQIFFTFCIKSQLTCNRMCVRSPCGHRAVTASTAPLSQSGGLKALIFFSVLSGTINVF